MEYILISEETAARFRAMINIALREGFVLHGDMCVADGIFYQSMIKHPVTLYQDMGPR